MPEDVPLPPPEAYDGEDLGDTQPGDVAEEEDLFIPDESEDVEAPGPPQAEVQAAKESNDK